MQKEESIAQESFLLTGDRYFVSFQSRGKENRQKKSWEFEGWISRIGSSRFLSLKCEASAGEVPEGAFVFANYQVIDQNTVVLRPLQLDSSPETSSADIRKEVRRRLKDQSLLPPEGARWVRISEIYWEPGYTGEQQFQPLRFPPNSSQSPAPGPPKKTSPAGRSGSFPLENSRIDGKVPRRKATKDDLVKARGVGVD